MSTVLTPPTSILMPGDPGWDDARQAWSLAVDQHPAAVARPGSAADVADVVRFAREHGLRVAAQGTGHNAAPLGSLNDTILVKTAAMRQVSIDPAARIARAEAGASGWKSSRPRPVTAWRRWRVPRPTSAWWDTRSAAG